MQTRRPAPVPLSDELFSKQAPLLLGHTNYDYCVKNTFLDLPSVHTPSSTKVRNPLLTAPAGLSKKMVFPLRTASGVPTTPILMPVLTPASQRSDGAHGTVTPLIEPPQQAAVMMKPEVPHNDSLESITHRADEKEDENKESEELCDDESPESQPQQLTRDDVPQPPPGALHPSMGSSKHMSGACKRCCFFPRGRCMNGYECEFCHYSHENRKRKNKKGSKNIASSMSSASDISRAASSHGYVNMQPPMMTYTMGGDGANLTQVLAPMRSGMTMQGAMAMQGNMGVGHMVVMQPVQMCTVPALQQAGCFPMGAQMIAVAQQQPQRAQPQLQPQQLLPQSQHVHAKVYSLPPAMASQSSWGGQDCVLAPPPPPQSPKVHLTLASQNLGVTASPPQQSPKFYA
mmetsp:Transcript_33601/g.85995  ORF Transcript_33601/g.85995 Transcript_33601/m.85995 type:complete len:401 (-) Transcript_33601:474-1676(-)